MREEFIKIHEIKDPNAKILEMSKISLGNKNKVFNTRNQGNQLLNQRRLKSHTELQMKKTDKKTVRPHDESFVAQKQELRDRIMAKDNKNLIPLEYGTTVLKMLKLKDKKMYRYITRAGGKFPTCSNFMNPQLIMEKSQTLITTQNQLANGKANAVSQT